MKNLWSLLSFFVFQSPIFANVNYEAEAVKLGKILKPISDDQWKTITNDREGTGEEYEIVQGDTLWDISKRLFGDPRYWPKIWALNNKTITNPHQIKPKNLIAFMPGTGSALPQVAIRDANQLETSTPTPDLPSLTLATKRATHSQEWKLLPKQPWETVSTKLPQEVDPDGFDKRNKIKFNVKTGFDLNSIPSAQTLKKWGVINGAKTPSSFLSSGDIVFFASDEKLIKGDVYAVTENPSSLASRQSSRKGYSYRILGKVEILDEKNSLYIGKLFSVNHPIKRGNFLIKPPPRAENITPIPGKEAIEGEILLDKSFSTSTVAQHKQIYIDLGSEDGIELGMVFRSYEYRDPSNNHKITSDNIIINADILVIHVTDKFSVGLIIRCASTLEEHKQLVLLTDISDLYKNKGAIEKSLNDNALSPTPVTPQVEETPKAEAAPQDKKEPENEPKKENNTDELDPLDDGQDLNKDEAKELKQLEEWKDAPPTQISPPETESPPDLPAPPMDGGQ